MSAPSYTTDLSSQVISNCENNTGFTNIGTGADATETDYYIQGSACVSKPFNITTGGIYYDNGSGITFTSGECFWVWYYFGCPNALLVEASGGLRALIGSSGTAYRMWNVLGNDTYTYGGWKCIPIDPINVSADGTTGSPTSTRQTFGVYCNTSVQISKGNPLGLDSMKRGRGEARMNGGDGTNGYATFSGFATQNDSTANRWGLIQAIDGGYLQQGLVVLGYSSAVDFRDSNVNVVIANTKKVQSSFNRWEVRQSGSRVDWTNINISALGTVSKGEFECIDNADVNFDTCVFTGMSTFVFQSGSTILNSTFRRCGVVTQGGATFTNCTFDSASGAKALVMSSATAISDLTFISSGTGYAIEGFSSAGDYTLAGMSFSGYAGTDGTTGNEALHVLATSGTVNIYVDGSPKVHSAGATVNVISGTVDTKVTVKDISTGLAIENARVLLYVTNGDNYPYQDSVSITSDSTTATVTHASHGMSTGDYIIISGANEDAYNGVRYITKTGTNSYTYTMPTTASSPATGTITATFAIIGGETTNASGIVLDSRTWSSNQLFEGWARKGTGSPTYIEQAIEGEVDKDVGFSVTVQLIRDE